MRVKWKKIYGPKSTSVTVYDDYGSWVVSSRGWDKNARKRVIKRMQRELAKEMEWELKRLKAYQRTVNNLKP